MRIANFDYIAGKTMFLIKADITGYVFIDDLIKIFIVIPLAVIISICTIVFDILYLSVITVYISFQHLTIIPIAFIIWFIFG